MSDNYRTQSDDIQVAVEEFTTSDGCQLKFRRYRPEGKPRANVVCIHGVQSHSGWYAHSCDHLRRAGFDVRFLDRRGAGLNMEDRGDAPSFRRLLDDIAEFLKSCEGLPRFLLAISWGGKLVAALQKRHPGLIDGLSLLCPGFCPQVQPSFLDRCGIILARLFQPSKKFPIPLNDPELFTATPGWQKFIRDDPIGLREATARFMIESVRLDYYLYLVPRHVKAPLLLMLAEHDRIIDNARTRRFVDRFASVDKQVIEYPGAHHTLEFEPDGERHVRDLIAWMEKVLGKRVGTP